MIKVFTADNCPECKKLERYLPDNVMIINTSTNDGYAEAMLESIYSVPAVIIDGHKFTGFYECRKLFMGE